MSARILVLTGMHRSGTSLLASLLQRGGVDIGRDLMAPDPRNPRGFFEDLGFFGFHERALLSRGTTPYVDASFAFEPTSAERQEAGRLVAERQDRALWGWKDPRTALFLDFWHELLPEARYLFVYRHPLEVLLSLVRRGEAHTIGLAEGLTAWSTYNSRILAFRERYPEKSLLCETFGALGRPGELASLIGSRLGIEVHLDRATVDSLYHREELRRLPRSAEIDALLREVCPEAMAVYEALEAKADVASDAARPAAGAPGELAGLARATACLGPPHPPARTRGLLLLLLAALDEALLERYFAEHRRYVLHLEQDRGRLQSALDAEAATVKRQAEWLAQVEENNRAKQAWIETLEENNRAKQAWIEALEENNRARQAWIEALEADGRVRQQAVDAARAELGLVQGSRAWRLARRLADSLPGRLARRLLASRRQDKEPE